jgi:hypothetical protein
MPTAARGPRESRGNIAADPAESGQEPDGAEILDRLVAGIYADMRARQDADAEGTSGAGGREPGNGVDPDP